MIQTLARKKVVQISARPILRTLAQPDRIADQAKSLSSEQQAALEAILDLLQPGSAPHTLLLHGVTGSGKTEVYLQAIATVLAQQQSALVLVPEIGLTPQLTDRFRARFGKQVLVYHSGLSEGERYDTWRLMVQDTPQVVIGTRSAIFAPLPKLGLLVLDEEHDDSYKQDQPQPCYHAATVAQWRSELVGCPLVLGSATPALETYAAALSGRIRYAVMPHRINPQPLPRSRWWIYEKNCSKETVLCSVDDCNKRWMDWIRDDNRQFSLCLGGVIARLSCVAPAGNRFSVPTAMSR